MHCTLWLRQSRMPVEEILAANALDVAAARSRPAQSRVDGRPAGAELRSAWSRRSRRGVRDVAALPDPVGEVVRGYGSAQWPADPPDPSAARRRGRSCTRRVPTSRSTPRRCAIKKRQRRRCCAGSASAYSSNVRAGRRAVAPQRRRPALPRGCHPAGAGHRSRASVTHLLQAPAAWSTWSSRAAARR